MAERSRGVRGYPEMPAWAANRIRELADEVTAQVPLDGVVSAEFTTGDSDSWADDRDGEPCSRCGGEVWVECNDPIQCTYRGCNGEIHPDPCCQGTGLARHQVIW